MGEPHPRQYAGPDAKRSGVAGWPMPVICGPTAGGKSALGVDLAQRVEREGLGRGEVVSCDSMQVYRGMDVGTGKLTLEERRGVAHHLIDVADPEEPFSVQRWLTLADRAVGEIRARGNWAIVVGGSHLYVKAFMEGLFVGPLVPPEVREGVLAMAPEERRRELERVDPASAARLHAHDQRRTIRALEVYRGTGVAISRWQTQWDANPARGDRFLVGLLWAAEQINPRINARVREMVSQGLVEEARGLWDAGRLGPQACEGLGYKQLVRAFEGKCTLEEAIERTKIETRRFAKNQRTWLKRLRGAGAGADASALWIDAGVTPPERWVNEVVRRAKDLSEGAGTS